MKIGNSAASVAEVVMVKLSHTANCFVFVVGFAVNKLDLVRCSCYAGHL